MGAFDHELDARLSDCLARAPQRFSVNYELYRRRGGIGRLPEFLERSIAADPTNASDGARLYFFMLAFDFLEKEGIPGDIAELGVYKGGTAALLAAFGRESGRTTYLFDTFEGFPERDFVGVDAGTSPAFDDTSLEAVREAIGEEKVLFIKGRFPDTASAVSPDTRFSLVHLDCDLFVPMRDALAFFYPLVSPGGFIVVHDYSSLAWNGPELAVDDFLADKPESVVPLPDSAGSIVIRKIRDPRSDIHWKTRRAAELLRGGWAPAANGALRWLLASGWGSPEDWGVWGVEDAHILRLIVPWPVECDYELSADVNAALLGKRTEQTVTVACGGQAVAFWRFDLQGNRSERSVRLPASAAREGQPGFAEFEVVFRPRFFESPAALDAAIKDTRPLGMAVHAIRLKALDR